MCTVYIHDIVGQSLQLLFDNPKIPPPEQPSVDDDRHCLPEDFLKSNSRPQSTPIPILGMEIEQPIKDKPKKTKKVNADALFGLSDPEPVVRSLPKDDDDFFDVKTKSGDKSKKPKPKRNVKPETVTVPVAEIDPLSKLAQAQPAPAPSPAPSISNMEPLPSDRHPLPSDIPLDR